MISENIYNLQYLRNLLLWYKVDTVKHLHYRAVALTDLILTNLHLQVGGILQLHHRAAVRPAVHPHALNRLQVGGILQLHHRAAVRPAVRPYTLNLLDPARLHRQDDSW